MHNTAQELRTPDYVLARNVPVNSSYLEENKRYKVASTFISLLVIEPDESLGYTKGADGRYESEEYILSRVKGSSHLDGGDWTRGYIYHV